MQTADEILKMTRPGDLFSPDIDKLKAEFRSLAKEWHPDVHPNPTLASQVMKVINDLHTEGLRLLKEGKWARSNFVQFTSTTGQLHNINFLAEHAFELGKYYVCNTIVVYAVDKGHKSFYDNYINRVKILKYHNSDMESEFKKYVPNIKASFETDEHLVIVVDKTKDVVSLRDVLSHFNGALPDRHMAWILSSLYNLACFLNYNKLSHNGITVDNYYISPQFHSGALLGGWWYTVKQGEKMLGAPRDVFEVMSHKAKDDKLGSYATDLDSIRQLGRYLSGDKTGRLLQKNTSIPKPIIDWLLGGSSKNPVEEYTTWGKALDNGYGKRRFVELALTSADLYK